MHTCIHIHTHNTCTHHYRDFSPVSGPTSGGTRLTITGANLGAMADDIMVELLKMEGQSVAMREQCAVDHSSYIPGLCI